MEYLRNILKVEPANGEAWGNLGHCYLMMDNLQEAYSAYQQALYYLPDPKVGQDLAKLLLGVADIAIGTKALVWHWHPLRPIRITGARRGSLLPGHAHAARFRESQRNLLPTRHHLQATTEVPAQLGGEMRPPELPRSS